MGEEELGVGGGGGGVEREGGREEGQGQVTMYSWYQYIARYIQLYMYT